LEELIAGRGMPKGDLSELLSAPTSAPSGRTTGPRSAEPMAEAVPDERPIVPVESLAPAPAVPEAPEAPVPVAAGDLPAPDEEGAVPIDCLTYSGEAALRRALALRAEIAQVRNDDARVQALLSEVFDLVELGLGPAR
jgi:hypothetical protein